MREHLRAVAAETVEIASRGWYLTGEGNRVDLGDLVAAAVAGTHLYQPGDPVPPAVPAGTGQVVTVVNQTTLAAARALGSDVACLVFASARHPGGGFLNGARAQEESLARASALYACQNAAPGFYDFHRQHPDPRYSDRVIYSPAVPVFRDDDGTLLARPYLVSFLTAAAPNLGAILASQPDAAASVPDVLRGRAARVLEIAAAQRHRRLILGAWAAGSSTTTRHLSPRPSPACSVTSPAGSTRSSSPSMTTSPRHRPTPPSPAPSHPPPLPGTRTDELPACGCPPGCRGLPMERLGSECG